jgi:GNAT superfamily N-acetyltransferase
MPTAETFSLRSFKRADAPAVRNLWTSRFGGDPSTQTNWMEAALDPSHTAAGFVAVTSDDTIVGTSFLDVGHREYTHGYLGLDALDLDVPLADRNGIFHLSCVQADWEGRGIGSAFYERRLSVLAAREVPQAFGIAWHRPAAVDSRALFEKYGFAKLATVERYYARTGTRPHCPLCEDTCMCPASVYGRSVPLPNAS